MASLEELTRGSIVKDVFWDALVTPCSIRQPFTHEPDFGVTSVNSKLEDLLCKGGRLC